MQIEVEDLPVEETQISADKHENSDSISHLAIANHFNVENPNKEEEKKLREIWNFGKTISDTGEITDVMWQVMHLSRTMGAPRLGETLLDKVYRWAVLKRQEKEIQAELQSV